MASLWRRLQQRLFGDPRMRPAWREKPRVWDWPDPDPAGEDGSEEGIVVADDRRQRYADAIKASGDFGLTVSGAAVAAMRVADEEMAALREDRRKYAEQFVAERTRADHAESAFARASAVGAAASRQLGLAKAALQRSREALDAFDGRGVNNFDIPTAGEVLNAWRASLDGQEGEQ